ncbi:hypothetical protein [Vibrio alginolyticus]|uniref:hypothetical protein n=1 Tax=Vibrio alginolyticus TaxID=663 RepID=UPI001BD5C08D|nr:hypothetical protein [Vibrio alginolyticus]ELA9085351.1 hypothetical protein [Vibrio alginolyticus]ELI1836792.1 hypothetical protein [Vibrio alginolyticus]MBS9821041.1 hypothetical protein [Vibrio alginolyticus]
MKYKNVIKISAIGTRGKVKGLEFVAKQNLDGHYVLNKRFIRQLTQTGQTRQK